MKTTVIVIGAGPVGIRAVEEISARNNDVSIALYGDEPVQPYNRVQLSNYLAGTDDFETIKLTPKIHAETRLETHYGCAIEHIDSAKKMVYRVDGHEQRYDKLVLATGSHAHLPVIENNDLDGIFTLRSINDADILKARKRKVTVVVGGGLLGLETARALHSQGGERVIIVEHLPALMSRQLNEAASEHLKQKVLAEGMEVILANGVKQINGDRVLQSIELRDGSVIDCDTLIFAIGIRANTELAKVSNILTRRGIVVDDYLQTSAPDVYAVGECIEFDYQTYGIVAPGFEQARVMAINVCGGNKRYTGAILSTRLKVLNYPVFSMGRVGENEPGLPCDQYTYVDTERQIYRHLVVHRRVLIGCIGLGDWTELSRIRSAIENRQRLWPCHIKQFQKTGLIWADKAADSVIYWPDSEIVCNCSRVTRGQLGSAINSGCNSVAALGNATQAGLTCGSCVSLLSELVGSRAQAIKAFKALAACSILALIMSLVFFIAPTIPYQQQATVDWFYDQLWRDQFFKLFSGYSLLACSLIVLLLSLRKRIDKFSKGDFVWWRMMHVIVGAVTLLVLLAHTGFRLGNNLNFYLMISFCGLLTVGAIAGIIIAVEHKLNPGVARKLRTQMIWGHILLFWPLPVLLGFHIMQTYYF